MLALLRRPEGATIAQSREATGWQQHTVRGFFAGLKKRQGIAVEVLERVRQVGPDKAAPRAPTASRGSPMPADRRHGTAPRYACSVSTGSHTNSC